MKTKLSPRFWTALTVFSLMGQIAWVVENMYFNVFIYKMFHASAADISAMVAASAVCATLTTVFIGALSDKIGKRKFFICLGYIFWGFSIFAFVLVREDIIGRFFPMAASAASVGVSLSIILDCVMTFFGSSANDAAFNAWLTDSTNSSNRGAAEGINAMMPLVAILCVFGGFMFFDLEKAESWSTIFTIIGVLVLFVGILGFFMISETKVSPSDVPYFKSIFYGFRPSTMAKNPTLYASLAAFIIFNISIQIFMPYLIIYYEVSLGMKDYIFIMAPAIILASVVTALWGKVYDKKGFTFSGLFSMASLILGYIVLFFFRNTALVFIGSLLMMCGYLSGMAVFGAIIRESTPYGKSGMLQGVRIFSQVLIPGIVGPYIGKLILDGAETIVGSDGTTSFVPNENIFLGALIVAAFVLPFFIIVRKTVKPPFIHLETPFCIDETPHDYYPRPQLRRDSYFSLNGKWNLTAISNKTVENLGEILVPFPPESRLSGICREISKKEVLHYVRTFTLPKNFRKDRVILHFGAVDQYTGVYINDKEAGLNKGGYLPFSFDVTDLLTDGENKIRVEVFDPLDRELPYGKQTDKRGGMWYTKTCGIWQTVWIESVPKNYISSVKITPTLNSVKIEVEGGENEKNINISTPGGAVFHSFVGKSTVIDISSPVNWTPEHPYLYNFTLKSGYDEISSYFALRTVGIKDGKIELNGKPYFFHGLLDQGYWPDGIFTPATAEAFEYDILQMKKCGFNMLRKHIKLEPDIFYYLCDKLGMAVFQDFINSGKYSFIIDTALPTVLPSVREENFSHKATKRRREEFIACSEGIVSTLYNHPCVVYYTIFNEGWGQFDATEMYRHFKELDPTRVYDTTSGWFKADSDVESDHVYFKPVDLKKATGKPMVLSEFGGYVCKIDGHNANPRDTYGYKFFKDTDSFEEALIGLYDNEIIPHIEKGLCAAVLTQVSDVEDETNGLLTYDRKILKCDPDKMKELSERIYTKHAEINVQ